MFDNARGVSCNDKILSKSGVFNLLFFKLRTLLALYRTVGEPNAFQIFYVHKTDQDKQSSFYSQKSSKKLIIPDSFHHL